MIEVARLVLAAVFVVAGVGKLVDMDGGRSAMRGFGVAQRLAAPAAMGLGLVEVLVGAALVPAATAHLGAGGALVLLAVMLTVTVSALVQGRSPSCHCFGALHSAPVGPVTVVRIVALADIATAVALLSAEAPSAVELVAVVAAAVVVVQGITLFRVLRRYGRALARIDELERGHEVVATLDVGALAPAFALPNLGGSAVSLEELLAPGLPLLVVFVDPLCGPCREIVPRLGQWQGEFAGRLTLAVISGGERDDIQRVVAPYGLRHILMRSEGVLPLPYVETPTPAAIAIAPDGTIARETATGSVAIEALLQSLEHSTPTAAVHQPALGAAAAGITVVAASASNATAAVPRQSEQDELAGLRAALEEALAAQATRNKQSIAAIRSKTQAGRSAAARRARARTRSRLQAERDDAVRRRNALAATQLTAARAESARQHMLMYLKERELFLADLRRLPSASRREVPTVEQSADGHLQTAYSHLATAVQLTAG